MTPPNTIAEILDTYQSDREFYNAMNSSNDDIGQKK